MSQFFDFRRSFLHGTLKKCEAHRNSKSEGKRPLRKTAKIQSSLFLVSCFSRRGNSCSAILTVSEWESSIRGHISFLTWMKQIWNCCVAIRYVGLTLQLTKVQTADHWGHRLFGMLHSEIGFFLARHVIKTENENNTTKSGQVEHQRNVWMNMGLPQTCAPSHTFARNTLAFREILDRTLKNYSTTGDLLTSEGQKQPATTIWKNTENAKPQKRYWRNMMSPLLPKQQIPKLIRREWADQTKVTRKLSPMWRFFSSTCRRHHQESKADLQKENKRSPVHSLGSQKSRSVWKMHRTHKTNRRSERNSCCLAVFCLLKWSNF